MANEAVAKVAINVAHDASMLKKRFPGLAIAGSIELASPPVSISLLSHFLPLPLRHVCRTRVKAAVKLSDYSLATMVNGILGKHVDKRIEHHLWELPTEAAPAGVRCDRRIGPPSHRAQASGERIKPAGRRADAGRAGGSYIDGRGRRARRTAARRAIGRRTFSRRAVDRRAAARRGLLGSPL